MYCHLHQDLAPFDRSYGVHCRVLTSDCVMTKIRAGTRCCRFVRWAYVRSSGNRVFFGRVSPLDLDHIRKTAWPPSAIEPGRNTLANPCVGQPNGRSYGVQVRKQPWISSAMMIAQKMLVVGPANSLISGAYGVRYYCPVRSLRKGILVEATLYLPISSITSSSVSPTAVYPHPLQTTCDRPISMSILFLL